MKPPSTDVLRSLCNLQESTDFGRVLEWLRQTYDSYRQDLENCPPEEFRVIQGRSKEIGEILRHNDTAYEVLKKRILEAEIEKSTKTF